MGLCKGYWGSEVFWAPPINGDLQPSLEFHAILARPSDC